MQNLKKKLLWIEILKSFAALMITNSHYKLLYPENLSALGTLGAPGNALFFFISGYVLILGEQKDFSSWYQKRIKRLWITPFIFASILAPILFNENITINKLWLGGDFWFIKCIAIYYILFYFIRKFNYITPALWFSFFFSIVYFLFILPPTPFSIYINNFHYICFFSFMIMGAYFAQQVKQSKQTKSDITNVIKWLSLAILSLILFYAIQLVGKGRIGFLYYIQIISLVPLHLFIISIYKLVNINIFEQIFAKKIIRTIILTISSLTLEIYVVGFHFIYITQFNSLFPINLLIVTFILLCCAYTLKVLSNIFLLFIENKNNNWKECFYIYKN